MIALVSEENNQLQNYKNNNDDNNNDDNNNEDDVSVDRAWAATIDDDVKDVTIMVRRRKGLFTSLSSMPRVGQSREMITSHFWNECLK